MRQAKGVLRNSEEDEHASDMSVYDSLRGVIHCAWVIQFPWQRRLQSVIIQFQS